MRIAHLSTNITNDPIKPGESFRTWCGIDHTAVIGTEGSENIPICARCHAKFQENLKERMTLAMNLATDLSEELARWDSEMSYAILGSYVDAATTVNSRYGILLDGVPVAKAMKRQEDPSEENEL